MSPLSPEHLDVLIVGAGISGIGAGCHLQMECPGKRYAILEGRADIGGTWDLFRYPGIRSDSDMYTLGYSFRPWTQAKAIAAGDSRLPAQHGAQLRRRSARSFPSQGEARNVVFAGRALDGRSRARPRS